MHKPLKIYYKILLTVLVLGSAFGLSLLPVYLPVYIVLGLLLLAGLCLIILKDPMWGMYLLVFFLPFERIGSYDIAGVTVRLSQVIALLTVLAWIFRGLDRQSFKLRTQPLFWPMLVFLALSAASIFNSPNLDRSLKVWIFTAFTFGVSLLIPNIIRHGDQLPRLIKILGFSLFLVGSFGLYQFVGDIIGLSPAMTGLREQYTKEVLGFPRVQGTALEPLYFANYLLLPLCVFISLFLSKAYKFKPLIMVGLIILAALNLILTVARGGYIAFAACLIIFGLMYFKKLFNIKIIFYSVLAAAFIYLGANYFLDLNIEGTKEKFVTHAENIFSGASYVERVYTMEEAYHAWLAHPLLGIGPGSFGPYVAAHPLDMPENGYLIVNNEYVELLAETGVLGFLLFVLIIVIIYVRSIKAIKMAKDKFVKAILIGLLVALAGILVQYNTFSILYIMHIWVTIGLIVACQNIIFLEKYEKQTA